MFHESDGAHGPSPSRQRNALGACLRENVHYTFLRFNFLPTFMDLLLEVGVDIMFSTDRPCRPMSEGRAFLDRLPDGQGANCACEREAAVWGVK